MFLYLLSVVIQIIHGLNIFISNAPRREALGLKPPPKKYFYIILHILAYRYKYNRRLIATYK